MSRLIIVPYHLALPVCKLAYRIVFIISLLVIIAPERSQAQNNYPVEYIGIEQGLSNNAVTAIYQDHTGFMWFGTYDGLNRYDGYSFKIFRNKLDDASSLINNRIVTIWEDKQHNLWIGTKQGVSVLGQNALQFQSVRWTSHQQKTTQVFTHAVNDIKTDNNGNIYIGTGGQGLLCFRSPEDQGTQIPFMDGAQTLWGYHVQAIRVDRQQRTWVFIQGKGLCLLDQTKQIVQPASLSIRSGYALETDNEGNIWIGTENGLVGWNPTTNTTKEYNERSGALTNNKVVGLCMDKAGKLWIATDGGGVGILNTHNGDITHLTPGQNRNGLTSAAVYAVYEDKEARKWIGTLRGGINLIDVKRNRFTTIAHNPLSENSLVDNFVLSFCEDPDGNIWIGTDGAGVNYWNRKQNTWKHYNHQPSRPGTISNNFVTSIVRDDRNNIWIATYGGGINRFNPQTQSFTFYNCNYPGYSFGDRNVWKLYLDSKHTLWAGATAGGHLYRYNEQTDKFQIFDLKLTDVITLAEDRSGTLWGGTYTDIVKIDPASGKYTYYKTGSAVRSIYEDKAGNYWVGTEGNGLLLFDRSKGTFSRFTESDGLSSNAVLNILEDKEGNLWISTYNGISKFNYRQKIFRNFYVSDGLQSNQFNYNAALRLKTGELIFGGIKGFNIFYPDSIRDNQYMPDLLVTGFRINNTSIEQDSTYTRGQTITGISELRLPYNKAAISIDFAALEFSAPDKIAYAYYMEGWDKDWNYVNKLRTANYTRLNEGNYTLRIKSTNAEGIWNPQERIIHIIVSPPWFRTWWAYLIYGLILIMLVRLYLVYKNRQARLQYEIQIAHINAEKEKELNEKKLSFFTNISHEFRTPLTLIINPIKELLYSKQESIDPGELNIVYRNARRLLSLVDQLLLFRKADSDGDELRVSSINISDLCREVYLCFVQQARSKKIQYDFHSANPDILVYVDREKIEIALFNLITNALKFTPPQGVVKVEVMETDSLVVINIADTGIGIPGNIGNKLFDRFYQVPEKETVQKTGFGIGLYLVKHFIQSHHGVINYTSTPGQGTRFSISLLKGAAHFPAKSILPVESTSRTEILEELMEEEIPETDIMETAAKEEEGAASMITELPTMLVIDDNQQIRQYILQLFRKTFHLYEADNGEQGLQLARQYQPDIIISDVMMQGISGIELCAIVKEDPALNHTPFILLTASSSSDIKLKGVECGADDYITKPFEKELLMARVSSILKSRNNLQKYFYNEITLQQNSLRISPEYKEFLDRCIAIVEAHLDDESFSIKTLASEIGMSHSNLYKKVKSISGQSVNAFIRYIRLRKAAALFINTPCNVNEAAFEVGISDIKYFREQFNKLFGMNPSEYIKKYRKPFQKNFQIKK